MKGKKFIVDGYNLLFSLLSGENLRRERELLIREVNDHAKRRALEVTLVFDAMWTEEPLVKLHFDTLEILFTAKGVTADDQILQMLEQDREPLLVTSDQVLAKRAALLGGKSLSSALFFNWLKGAKKKKRQRAERVEPSAPRAGEISVVTEGSLHWYEKIFEERL